MVSSLGRRRLSRAARWGILLSTPWLLLSAPGCEGEDSVFRESDAATGGGGGNDGSGATGGMDPGAGGEQGGSAGSGTGGNGVTGGTGATGDGGEGGDEASAGGRGGTRPSGGSTSNGGNGGGGGSSGTGAIGGTESEGGARNLGGEDGGGASGSNGMSGASSGGVAGATGMGSGGDGGASAGSGSGGAAGSSAGTGSGSGGDAGSSMGGNGSGGDGGASAGSGSGGTAGASAGTGPGGGAGGGGSAGTSGGGGTGGIGLCVPNASECVGNFLAQCNGDGSGYLPDPVDCGVTAASCCDGACRTPSTYDVTSSQVTVGSTVINDDGTRMNTFQVRNGDAWLMGIGQSIRTTTAMTLGWYVYEAGSKSVNQLKVFERQTTSTTATVAQTSGPMCVKLLANRYYTIGAGWRSRPVTVYTYSVTLPHPAAPGPVVDFQNFDNFPPPGVLFWRNITGGGLTSQKLTIAR